MKLRGCFCVFVVVCLIFALSFSAFADDELAKALNGKSGDYFDFDTESAWCVRFARWFCVQAGLSGFPLSDYCDTCYNASNAVIVSEDSKQKYDWIFFDYNDNGEFDHVGVYLGDDCYIGGNESGGRVVYHDSIPSYTHSYVRYSSSSALLKSVVSPVDPVDTSGFKQVLLQIIGPYDCIVNEYSYTGSNGYTQYVREITPDYIWMISVLVFLVVLYSIFRITYGLAVGGRK